MTKKIVVPVEKATNVTLFGEHYDVVDGMIEVPNAVAKQVLAEPDLQHAAGHGLAWKIADSSNGADSADSRSSKSKETKETKETKEI